MVGTITFFLSASFFAERVWRNLFIVCSSRGLRRYKFVGCLASVQLAVGRKVRYKEHVMPYRATISG